MLLAQYNIYIYTKRKRERDNNRIVDNIKLCKFHVKICKILPLIAYKQACFYFMKLDILPYTWDLIIYMYVYVKETALISWSTVKEIYIYSAMIKTPAFTPPPPPADALLVFVSLRKI